MNSSIVAAYLLGRIVQSGKIRGVLGPIQFSFDKGLGLSSLGRPVRLDAPGLWLECEHDQHTRIGFMLEKPSNGVLNALALSGYVVHSYYCYSQVFHLLDEMWPGVLAAKFSSTQTEPGDGSEADLETFRGNIACLRERAWQTVIVRIRAGHPLLKT